MYPMTEAHVFALQEARRCLRMCAARSRDGNLRMRYYKTQSLLKTVEKNVELMQVSDDIGTSRDRNNDAAHPV